MAKKHKVKLKIIILAKKYLQPKESAQKNPDALCIRVLFIQKILLFYKFGLFNHFPVNIFYLDKITSVGQVV